MNAASNAISGTHSRAIRKWKFLFDRVYQDDESAFSGWVSSYDGLPIPLAEMEDWLDRTIDRILRLRPASVLEIGCGTGLIARRVAPHVARYRGVDIAPAAIRQLTASIGGASDTQYLCGAAHEVAELFDGGFDLVILNSVVQYFGDAGYLDTVLAAAIALLRPGGSLFIGDVRNADLADAFAASVALARADDGLPSDELRETAASLAALNGELQLSPSHMRGLMERFARISRVTALLKSGAVDNELTRFRYDVIIGLDEAPPERPSDVLSWREIGSSLAGLEDRLRAIPDRALRVTGIGNARLAESLAAQRQMIEAPSRSTAGDVRRAVGREVDRAGRSGEEPDAFETLGARLGFDVSPLCGDGGHALFDVLFVPAAAPDRTPVEPS